MEAHKEHRSMECGEIGGRAGSGVIDCDIDVAARTLSRFRSLLIRDMVCLHVAYAQTGRRLKATVLALTIWELALPP